MKMSAEELSQLREGQLLWLHDHSRGAKAPMEAIFMRKLRGDRIDLKVQDEGGGWESLPWSLIRNAPVSGGGAKINQKIWLTLRD